MARSIESAMWDGLAALVRMQSPDGSFPLWTGTKGWRPCAPLFSTAYILMGIGSLLPREVARRAADYIRRERGRDGMWQYDKTLPLPPDSDDTACCLAALARHGDRSDTVGGADLLRAFWRKGTGPFRTWLPPSPLSGAERDDAVVNGNILFALRLLGSEPTEEEREKVGALFRRSDGSRYYCYPATLAHSAARAGLEQDVLSAAARERPAPDHALAVIQYVCAADVPEPELVELVLKGQRADGSWPIWPWVTAQQVPRPYWGSPAVTTALAVEALGRQLRFR